MGTKSLDPWPNQYILTYRNFGRVNLNGLDLGLRFSFNDRATGWLNYSHMNLVDLEDPANDFDGRPETKELSFNAPENKASIGIGLTDLFITGLFGQVSGCWVEEYDFISGPHSATKAGEGTGSWQFKDRGPLGGFTTIDVNLSYSVNPRLQLNLSATNLFDTGLRETVGSPEIRRLILMELRYTLQ